MPSWDVETTRAASAGHRTRPTSLVGCFFRKPNSTRSASRARRSSVSALSSAVVTADPAGRAAVPVAGQPLAVANSTLCAACASWPRA
jgi:hypothetical protein